MSIFCRFNALPNAISDQYRSETAGISTILKFAGSSIPSAGASGNLTNSEYRLSLSTAASPEINPRQYVRSPVSFPLSALASKPMFIILLCLVFCKATTKAGSGAAKAKIVSQDIAPSEARKGSRLSLGWFGLLWRKV